MSERTISWNVRFDQPAQLSGHVLAAGSYEVVAEEQSIDGLSFDAWHRLSLAIVVTSGGRTEMHPITQTQLDRALAAGGQDGLAPVLPLAGR